MSAVVPYRLQIMSFPHQASTLPKLAHHLTQPVCLHLCSSLVSATPPNQDLGDIPDSTFCGFCLPRQGGPARACAEDPQRPRGTWRAGPPGDSASLP